VKRTLGTMLLAAVTLSTAACGLGMDASSAQQAINQKDPAADVQAKADLQTAMVAAQQVAMVDGSYAAATAAALQQAEPSLSYVSGASSGPGVVSVAPSATSWSAAVLSTSGTCFYAVVSASGGTDMGSGSGACSATNASQFATQTG